MVHICLVPAMSFTVMSRDKSLVTKSVAQPQQREVRALIDENP